MNAAPNATPKTTQTNNAGRVPSRRPVARLAGFSRSRPILLSLLVGATTSALALTWQSPNRPDANTLALFHFDERSGAVTRSTDSSRVFNLTANVALWTPSPSWLATPSGSCLTGTNTITTAQSVGTSPSAYALDWSRPAITFSYWVRDTVQRQQENKHFYMGYGGWRNQQATAGYRPGWSNLSRLMYAGFGFPTQAPTIWQWNTGLVTDGQWHHVAFVGVRGGDGKTTLKYYIDNVQRNFTTNGVAVSSVTFTPAYTGSVSEFWYLLPACAASIDELLIQAEALTDFSNGYNALQPATVIILR